jgi:hypothetical protein
MTSIIRYSTSVFGLPSLVLSLVTELVEVVEASVISHPSLVLSLVTELVEVVEASVIPDLFCSTKKPEPLKPKPIHPTAPNPNLRQKKSKP